MPEETLPSPIEETPLDLKLDETALPPSEGRQIAAAKITDSLPASAYVGASTLSVTREQEAILDEPVPDNEIDIRPDGLIYVSHEYVRRQLNRAFGRLQWALVPGSPLVMDGNELYQRWVLLVQGTYVSEALASRKYFANGNQGRDDVAEAIKSDCLRRCCKDLGIGLEAWNRRRAEHWRRTDAIQVLCTTSQGNKKLWRRKDADPLNGEIAPPVGAGMENKGRADNTVPPAPPSAKTEAAPPPQTAPKPAPAPKQAPLKVAPKPQPTTLTITDGQIRLLWQRAGAAGLVTKDDVEPLIEFLHDNCMVDIPDRSGKKDREVAVLMMRTLPAGAQFQRLLKTLEIQAQTGPVEI